VVILPVEPLSSRCCVILNRIVSQEANILQWRIVLFRHDPPVCVIAIRDAGVISGQSTSAGRRKYGIRPATQRLARYCGAAIRA